MIFGTVCSGIGAPETAWKPLGWRPAFMAEIEPQACAVLAHHNPGVPLHGDFTTIERGQFADIAVLCGGTPCQSFSVAGLRGGMADDRGNLALEYLRLADRLRPRWLVWENVPGVLSSNGGRDFGAFLGGLVQLGYGFAYRVLDAQFYGVPQRRARVFVVGYLGDWRRAAAVLFEPASLRGDSPPSREKGEGIAATFAYGISSDCFDRIGEGSGGTPGERSGLGLSEQMSPALRAKRPNAVAYGPEISPALKSRDYKGPSSDGDGDGDGAPLIAHTLRGEGFDASEDGTGRRREDDHNLVSHALTTSKTGGSVTEDGTGRGAPLTAVGMAVRRLTPTECLRLQGFPDSHLDILYRGKPLADGPRYRLIGNSMAVPVMRKIGERIAMVDAAVALGVAA